MRVVALATYHTTPDSDLMLVEPLRQLGIEAKPTRWNDTTVDWSVFDAVVVRACWDYHLQPQAFRAWIEHLERIRVPLWNPPSVLRWNMDKHYLQELAVANVSIIPTVWVEQSEQPNLKAILAEQGWQKAIIKPCISASAYQTWPTHGEHQQALELILRDSAAMVQQFMETIYIGEWSLVFFLGVYSHAVLKAREPIDDSVRHGDDIPQTPPDDLIDQATHVLRSTERLLNTQTLYARVDGIWQDGQFILMELELIEPSLYISDMEQAHRFAQAIAEKTPIG